LTILQNANGRHHPSVARTLDNLAKITLATGEIRRAIEYQTQASGIEDHNLSLNLAAGAERWKLSYLGTLSKQTDRIISLQTKYAAKDAAAMRLAASAVIQRKGRVQDAMSVGLDALRKRFGPEDQALLDELNTTTAQLARLVLNGPGKMNGAEYQQRIKEAEEQRQKVEEEISHRSAGYFERSQAVALKEIQEAIPLSAALIEFAVYRPFNPKVATTGATYAEPHYVAYVLKHKGEVQAKELGRTSDVDKTIKAWRQALRDPTRKDVQQLARLVDAKVMQPLRALFGNAGQLLISPDGELNLIPFAALRDEQGKYLVEQYAVTYLTSGRDLLRTSVVTASKSEPVVLANPLFGEIHSSRAAQAHATNSKEKVNSRKKENTEKVVERPTRHFLSLAGTAIEAQSIKELFPEATVLTGAAATESAVKQLTAPRILHLATHGFFLQDATTVTTTTVTTSVTHAVRHVTDPNLSGIKNPLLRSGLALAGANERKGTDNDGILTALEATGINLWGTKLVVLSACNTGVGEVRTGEGVYGLRRAFALAGAQSVVMSLWPVSDYTTRRFMTTYYSHLKDGMGRGESLRRVQLEMLSHNRNLHPFYWSNFIQSGEWANLDGVR
jgi:CHAT domain-containing protein